MRETIKRIKELLTDESSRGSFLFKNSLLLTLSSFGSRIIVFLLVPLYTTVFSTSDYGNADLVTTTSQLLLFVVTANIGDAVLRFSLDNRNDKPEILRFGLRIIIRGVLVLSALVLAAWILRLVNWPDYCYLFLVLYVLFSAILTLFQNYLRGIDKVSIVSISGIITTLVTVVCNVIMLVPLKMGIIGYLISLILGPAVSSWYCLHNIGGVKTVLFGALCDKQTKREMLRYSFPLIFNGIAWWINGALDKYFIVAICGIAANGIYAVASKIPAIFSTVTGIFAQAWALSAVKEFEKKDGHTFFSKIYNLYKTALCVVCSVFIILNIPIARLLFAKDFFYAWNYSSVLLLSVLFNSLAAVVGTVFSAVKKSKMYAVSTVSAALMNTILNALLIPKYNALGGAIATAVSFLLVLLIRYFASCRYLHWDVNIVRDVLAMVVLVLQVCLEHTKDHCFTGQAICFCCIVFLCFGEIKEIVRCFASVWARVFSPDKAIKR